MTYRQQTHGQARREIGEEGSAGGGGGGERD